MSRRRRTVVAALASSMMLVAACSGDDDATAETNATVETDAPVETDAAVAPTDTGAPAATDGPTDTGAPAVTDARVDEIWAVNTDACANPAAANAPIEGTVKIASAMPLTGGVAAAAFAPIKNGFEAYIAFAREKGLFAGYDDINLTIVDDQYDAAQTPGAVASQIDAGAHLFSGIVGSPNNTAVRQRLNDECIPQLNALTGSPAWGEVAEYPWTTGILVPYPVESKVYAAQLGELYPEGATVGLLSVNNEFGQVYADSFRQIAGDYDLEIIAEQTIDATDSNPPTVQVSNLADAAPDVIMAVPLGAGCISFLAALAAAEAQTAGWEPAVFITNTCASSPILRAAGPAADNLYTSGNLKDFADPEVQTDPLAAEYISFMTGLGKADIVSQAAAGWTTGELTVAIVNQAAASPAGLTRASIINAARNFDYTPSLARAGVVAKSHGEQDPYMAESLQVLQYDADTATFTDVGRLVTEFET